MELRIEHLSKTYASGQRALDDVGSVVPSGLFGLLGPNGAGKSTLISTRLVHGEVELRSWALQRPGPLFEPAEPELEDAYFAAIRGFARAQTVPATAKAATRA